MLMSEHGAEGREPRASLAEFTALIERFRRRVEEAPGHLALLHSDGTYLSRRALWAEAEAIASHLAEIGVVRRDVVTLCLPNNRTWVPAYLAILQLGCVPATLPSTTDAAALASASAAIGSRAVLSPSDHTTLADAYSSDQHARTADLHSSSTSMEVTVIDRPERRADEPTFDHLMFTSGTTGQPRAVMHTEQSLAALNAGLADTYGLGEHTTLFMGSPLGHATGVMHGVRLSLFLGAPLLVQEKWDAAQAVDLITRHHAHFSIAATPFLRDLVDHAVRSGTTQDEFLRLFLCGGAPVPSALVKEAQERYPGMFVSPEWAMTEGGLTACDESDPPAKLPSTVGRTRCGLEVVVLDADQRPCLPGVTGELAMRGPGVFQGYLGQEELYRASLTSDGYFKTGDQAAIDEDGFVSITGRLKDLIIRGGVNIAPLTIEAELIQHPAIAQVAVIGKPDRRMGQRICAVVTVYDDEVDLESVLGWLAERGASKRLWPEDLIVVPTIPTTAAGKLAKHRLSRELFGKVEDEDHA